MPVFPLSKHRAFRRFIANPLSAAALVLVSVISLSAVFAPLIAPRDPLQQNLSDRRAKPLGKYPLGADQFGRDILSRVIFGARVSLGVSLGSILIALPAGIIIGAGAAWAGGFPDALLMRIMDLLLGFPYLLLAVLLAAVIGGGVFNTTLAIGIWALPGFARVVRSSVLSLKVQDYTAAARVLGASPLRIILRHILPNCIPFLLVYSALFTANAIMMEAALSFLGLGIQPPAPSWGQMVSSGRSLLMTAPHISIVPGIAVTAAVLGFNLLAEGLRDALDPGGTEMPF